MYDYELQELFRGYKSSFVYEFCKRYNWGTLIHNDETGMRFFIHDGDTMDLNGRDHFSTDNGFAVYVYYIKHREELIRNFTQFKRFRAFL